MQMRLSDLLEANGIRVVIVPTINAHELHKPPFGIAACAVPFLSEEQDEILCNVGLGGWYSSYSFTQDEVKYVGWIIAYERHYEMGACWPTEDAARKYLARMIELADG